MVLSEANLGTSHRLFLFDTFEGIPATNLTDTEMSAGFDGRLSNVTLSEVRQRLATWESQVSIVAGDVFDTLRTAETGPLALVHLDLNAAAPTELVLKYVWPRLVFGGVIVCDDYGWTGYEDQRRVIDEFSNVNRATIISLPTGQALVIKS
jgi:O-methyltransferase